MSLSDGEPALAGSAARLVAETGMPSAAQNLPKAFACIRKAFISSLPFVFFFLDCGRCFLTPQWLERVIHNISAGARTDIQGARDDLTFISPPFVAARLCWQNYLAARDLSQSLYGHHF